MTTAGGEVKPDLEYDVAVVGAGMGGVYAAHRLTSHVLSVQGLEAAADVGGVWYMDNNGFTAIEPTTKQAQAKRTEHVAEVSSKLLRRNVGNYMVHVNDDGSRAFIRYAGVWACTPNAAT